MSNITTLYYVHDPMCSWCWGFKPVLELLTKKLSGKIEIKYVLGGLAEDSDIVMPVEMQTQIKSNWHNIQQSIPGIEFNYDFWEKCTPRRSTFPACRAVIATKYQQRDKEQNIIKAIQQAYYLQSENPSDYSVLYKLAETIYLDIDRFITDIHSNEVQQELSSEIEFSRSIGVNSLPSLVLSVDKKFYPIVLDYNNADIILEHIQAYI